MRPTLTESEILKLALISVFLGIILGILFDIFRVIRVFRKREGMGKLMRAADFALCFFDDLLFFLILTVLNTVLFSAYGAGTLRLEAIVIQFAVFVIWYKTMGKITVKFAVRLKALIFKGAKRIFRPIKIRINKARQKRRDKRREKRIVSYSNKEREKLKRNFRAS